MSDSSELGRSPEVSPTVDLIASGLSHWLKKEVGSSVVGRNQYLDNFNNFQQQLLLPYEAANNDNAQKNRSHHNTLREWTLDLVDQYDSMKAAQKDFAIARQIFCAQMYMSGLFRIQCFMQATDQDDYYHRRLENDYTGIDIEPVVTDRLERLFGTIPPPHALNKDEAEPEAPAHRLTLRTLEHLTLGPNDAQQGYTKQLHTSGHVDVGKEDSATLDANRDLQRAWTRVVTDYIVFAASEHGGQLAAVPFLEPKSISDNPQVYYPFVTTP